jgi:5-methyltetrahydrofolate--homocysteine methyltransferase
VLDTLLSFSPAAVNVMHTPAGAVSAALGELGARWRGYRGAYPELGSDAATQWNRPTTGVTTTVTEAPAPAPATSTGTALPASADASPARLADLAMTWVADGARILGGCCGSTPAHIRALREALDRGAH